MTSTSAIGSILRARRKRLGLTQLEAAELAGVSVRFVHDCENGKSSVQLDRVKALAFALGLTLSLTLRNPKGSSSKDQDHE